MNYSDTERVCSVLDAQGLMEVEDIYEADIAIMTTCSVKQKAEDKVFSTINNLHKNRIAKKKDTKILLTGCMVKNSSSQQSEIKDPLLTRIPKIDAVFRIEDVIKLPELLGIGEKGKESSYFQIIPKYKSSFQAIVPIQTGCDNFCTFCIVPFTRGREQSRSLEEILKEIQYLAKKGVKEIILVGQNVNSYGKGLPNTQRIFDEENSKWLSGEGKTPFTILLEEVSKIEGIERIRFQSSNPHDMTDDIIEAIGTLPKVMPSVHFALQSGDDRILQRMNRKHSFQSYMTIVEKLKKFDPHFSVTTDIIIGFSGEDEEAFKNSIKAMEMIDVDLIYISQYSVRKGTPAEKTLPDDVPQSVKIARWHEMNNWLKKHIAQKFKKLIGTKQKVLIEHKTESYTEGKTEYNHTCRILNTSPHIGDIVEVEITESSTWSLQGELNKFIGE